MKISAFIHCWSALLILTAGPLHAAGKEPIRAWADPAAALREDPDFARQGEYRTGDGKAAMGAQIVALGKGSFDVYILDGGLPGDGWEPGRARTMLKSRLKDGGIEFADQTGKTTATLNGEALVLTTTDRLVRRFNRCVRTSPTLGAKPPEGALVLFDGKSAEQWENGKPDGGHLLAANSTTKRTFGDYKLHLEFRTPYMPDARGQQRGNSGVYHSGRWETQILDSFGLEGKDNECGGIYSISKPQLNMCLPPLAWQTYDVDFTAARFDANGRRTAWPRITVKLNGVTVHDNLELNKDFTTSAPLNSPLTSPEGPVHIQNHNNPVVFRNIWIVPRGRP